MYTYIWKYCILFCSDPFPSSHAGCILVNTADKTFHLSHLSSGLLLYNEVLDQLLPYLSSLLPSIASLYDVVFVVFQLLQLFFQFADVVGWLNHNGYLTANCIQSVLNLME